MKVLKFTIEDYSFEIHAILCTDKLKQERNSHLIKLLCKDQNLNTSFVVYEDKGVASLRSKILHAKNKVAPMWVSEWNEKVDEKDEVNEMLNEMGFDNE